MSSFDTVKRSLIAAARLVQEAGRSWVRDNMPSMAAALAFHAILSMAPLLFVIVGAFRLLLGADVIEREIVMQVEHSLGPQAVQGVHLLLENMVADRSDAIAVGGGTVVLLVIFSTGFFQQLIHALNVVWRVSEEGTRGFIGGILRLIRGHFLSFVMVICVGLYLYVSVLMSAIKIIPERHLLAAFPAAESFFVRLAHILAPVVLFVLFMALFRVLPARRIAWRDVWCGALITAVLFFLSNRLILFYLQRTAVSSFYGAAGSFVIVLLWVYWSAMIVLFGAELSRVCAERYGTLRGRRSRP
jgi:membrane protein